MGETKSSSTRRTVILPIEFCVRHRQKENLLFINYKETNYFSRKNVLLCSVSVFVSRRRASVMERKMEETFCKDLKRERRSGSVAVMTESFQNLPSVVSTE